jgi:hypothetical protein
MNQINRYPRIVLGLSSALGTLLGCVAPPSAESTTDDRQAQLGILCEAQVGIAGRFEAAARRPSDVVGCWPVGTWTFSATVQSTDCASPPALEREYAFSVARDSEQIESYRFLNDPARDGVKLKVTSGGSGLCEGGLMIWSADRKTLFNLKPTLNADGTVAGNGEIELYATPQF